eukprot:1116881-Prorocentrum_minimum.AAC.1
MNFVLQVREGVLCGAGGVPPGAPEVLFGGGAQSAAAAGGANLPPAGARAGRGRCERSATRGTLPSRTSYERMSK